MNKKVVILGAGGHARVIADSIVRSGDEVVGFLDDNVSIHGNIIYSDKKVLGSISDCVNYLDYYFVIGIGNNEIRKKIAENYDLKWYTAIHPCAIIDSSVKIGEGTVVMPGAIINSGTVIGNHCVINTSSSIDHDNIIHDFVHVSPGAILVGTVEVGESSWICCGATIINNINICKNCIIGAGAVVIKNINISGTYVGVPARKVK